MVSDKDEKYPGLIFHIIALVAILLICAVLAVLVSLYFSFSFDARWFLVTVPIFVVGSLVALLVLNRGCGPLNDILAKTRRLASGESGVSFSEERERSQVREFRELAADLDEVNKVMRSTRAEALAEGQRQAQFISDVAHELRTPLTAMRGAAETLLDDDIPDEDRYHFCESIISECDRLTRLANDLLTLQRIEGNGDIALRRVDLHDIVERVVSVLEPLLEDRQVELTVNGEAPDVLGDPDRLQQVVVNLVENASRFAGKESDGQGRVHVELSGIKKHSVITVSDNGSGFGDIDPARLFDRFYRADFSRARTHGGTGLGLAIVKAIVSAHDGTVEAVNLPDGGACFIVAIPSLPPVDGIEGEMPTAR